MDVIQGEWIVKRRNCGATFNNRGRGNQNNISSTFHNKSHYMMSVNKFSWTKTYVRKL